MIVRHLARGGQARGASLAGCLCHVGERNGVLNRGYSRGRGHDIGSRFLSRTLAHAPRRNVRCAGIRDEPIDRGGTAAEESLWREYLLHAPLVISRLNTR